MTAFTNVLHANVGIQLRVNQFAVYPHTYFLIKMLPYYVPVKLLHLLVIISIRVYLNNEINKITLRLHKILYLNNLYKHYFPGIAS